MKLTMKQIIHCNEIRPSIFGTHFEPSTDVLLCCVRKIEEKEWESYFDGVAEAAALFHQTCRSHFSHPIYRILNFTPARTLNNWAKGKSHLFSLPIYSSISNLFHNLWSKIADEKGFQKFLLQNCFHNTKKMEKKKRLAELFAYNTFSTCCSACWSESFFKSNLWSWQQRTSASNACFFPDFWRTTFQVVF